ncbi:unnamed protein product [Hyaloperonospora brassicae]|uniref:DASH complex subunit DAM1 n=1 Tax=Hyaloperonospora brassicae TaxID=162125 RepID=A0AAV0UEK8_HYABA|nr:unnamed protein product [Hyaloperonospora brassicae]
MADPLIGPFTELCGALRGLQEQVEQLRRVHNAVDDFNSAFGAFQGAMALHASCLSYPKTTLSSALLTRGLKDKHVSPTTGGTNASALHTESGIHAKREGSLGGRNSSSKSETRPGNKQQQQQHVKPPKQVTGTANSIKRYGKVEPHGPSNTRIKRRRTTQTTKIAPPAWTWERHVREKIPRKYQSPAELKKLENIVLYLKNRHCAISISDLVNHSGLPVIRCKEILQTLMKLDIVERKREKSGFVYSFGSSG